MSQFWDGVYGVLTHLSGLTAAMSSLHRSGLRLSGGVHTLRARLGPADAFNGLVELGTGRFSLLSTTDTEPHPCVSASGHRPGSTWYFPNSGKRHPLISTHRTITVALAGNQAERDVHLIAATRFWT